MPPKPADLPTLMQAAQRAVQAGDVKAAERAFAGLVRLRPTDGQMHFNHARALSDLGRREDAEAALRKALQLAPDLAQAHTNLGNLLTRAGRLDEAEPFLRRAVALQPGNWRTHFNLASLLHTRGRMDEARQVVDRAVGLAPNAVEAHQLRPLGALYADKVSDDELFDLHRQAGQAIARQAGPPFDHHANDRDPERRLRIGYASPDLREHSVSYFISGILAAHDRRQVEVFCYADIKRPDAVSERLQVRADHWRLTPNLSTEQLAAQIRKDRIDVLVDLAGHMRGNRMVLFARKPAPVQATWIGYPATTGLDAIDLRFTDAIADPPGASEKYHSETLVRLDPCFLAYEPSPDAPPPGDCPALRGEPPVFGSFNNIAKLSRDTVETWAALLNAVPEARLVMKSSGVVDPQSFAWFIDILTRHGVAAERVETLPYAASSSEHLALYRRIDLALDPFPYNGTTTTCEALLMGVPTVALRGPAARHAARVSETLLNAVGLADLVADDRAAYVRLAASAVRDRQRMGELRQSLRQRFLASPLCDAVGLTRQVEQAYRQSWRRWCGRQAESS